MFEMIRRLFAPNQSCPAVIFYVSWYRQKLLDTRIIGTQISDHSRSNRQIIKHKKREFAEPIAFSKATGCWSYRVLHNQCIEGPCDFIPASFCKVFSLTLLLRIFLCVFRRSFGLVCTIPVPGYSKRRART